MSNSYKLPVATDNNTRSASDRYGILTQCNSFEE